MSMDKNTQFLELDLMKIQKISKKIYKFSKLLFKKNVKIFDTADNYLMEKSKIIGKSTRGKEIKIINKFKLINDKN